MPYFDFTCESCGASGRAWRPADKPPRFCNRRCRGRGTSRAMQGGRRTLYPVTPEMHRAIQEVYQNFTGKGQMLELAGRLGLPRWKVSRYAVNQGWIARQKKEPDWRAPELAILEQSAHCSLEVIQRRLRKAGFTRSLPGILVKRKRLKLPQNLQGQSIWQLADCFGVDQKVVQGWVFKGYLKAQKRGTHRTPRQGGDIYFIRDRWVRQFVLEHPELVDLRKVDKFWFIDLLAGRETGHPSWGAVTVADSEGVPGEMEAGNY
ncbi:MAG: hypothetical protein C4567_18765 [Deltaproteobacteria bacterium]|nr:MAG: hypothetical protein C4567_18765 [Deltaproteobacteria bacterium]